MSATEPTEYKEVSPEDIKKAEQLKSEANAYFNGKIIY